MSPLLTVAEVADRFGCRGEHVLNLIHSGQLAAVDVGLRANRRRPTWRISQDAVIDLERRRASGLPQVAARPHRRSPPTNVREFF